MISKENISKNFIDKLKKNYDHETINKILDGYKCIRKTTFRVNKIKLANEDIKSELIKLGIPFTNTLWYEGAFVLDNEEKITNTYIYQNGEIYLQSLSSMLPAIILNPQEKENILDMCAAPGGKTTQMAALSNNKAFITACEKNHIRAERLKYNIEKQGAKRNFGNGKRCKRFR